MKEYTIYLNGVKAVKIADKIIGNKCFTHIISEGKSIAQMEITLEDLVDVSYIESIEDAHKVIKMLSEMGFGGCAYTICDESDAEYRDDSFSEEGVIPSSSETKKSIGYYNSKVLAKFNGALAEAVEGVKSGKYMTVKFSDGNTKMGAVASVSTLPFITCPSICKETCGAKCYAAKLANLRPNVMINYAINTALAIHRPDLYWAHINDFVKGCRFFRFHVSGDILNAEYFAQMVKVAYQNPHCEFLCFTKRFNVVNGWIECGGEIPQNMHILYSGWTNLTPDNPYELPETNVFTSEADFNEEWKVCGGNCFNCACRGLGCWQAKKGDVVAFKMH